MKRIAQEIVHPISIELPTYDVLPKETSPARGPLRDECTHLAGSNFGISPIARVLFNDGCQKRLNNCNRIVFVFISFDWRYYSGKERIILGRHRRKKVFGGVRKRRMAYIMKERG